MVDDLSHDIRVPRHHFVDLQDEVTAMGMTDEMVTKWESSTVMDR